MTNPSIWTPGQAVSAESSNRVQTFIASAGQTDFIITNFTYETGTNSLEVSVSGVTQRPGIDYIETGSNSFSLTSPVEDVGTAVFVRGLVEVSGNPQVVSDASNVSYLTETVKTALDVRLPEIANYAGLRAYAGLVTAYYVRGVTDIFDGGAGVFQVDAADATTADNGGTVLVDAIARRWKRQYTGRVDLRWFGADPTGVLDSTAALINAFTHSSFVLLDGTYKTSSPITVAKSYLNILCSSGSSITYSGTAGSTCVLRFDDVDSFIIDGRLTIDCGGRAGIGLEVRGIDGASLVDVSGVAVSNCTHSSPSTSGASGIQISCDTSGGVGKIARVTKCSVSNVTRTTADGAGAVCSGITVTDFDVMAVDDNDVDGVYKGNGTVDADGVKVYSQLKGGFYTNSATSIRNNRVRNCEGRWVKTQTRGLCSIEDNYLANNVPLDLLTSFRGVDAQVGDTTVKNNTVELLAPWTGGAEMHIFQMQFNAPSEYVGQHITHNVLDNTVFSANGVPAFERAVFMDMTQMGVNAVTATALVRGNTFTGAGGWAGASVGYLAFGVRPPVGSFAEGATANIVIEGNRVNTTNFMERFTNGANASGANDFTGKLFLTVLNNYLPKERGDIPVLDHSANNSFTSSICVSGNSVGMYGNRVAMPFNFAHILGGTNFYVGGESVPARTNAPLNYTFGTIERNGAILRTDNGTYRYSSLAAIGAAPTWVRYGMRTPVAWTTGTYSTSRAIPNSATATTAQLADALNTLLNDLKLAGFAL